MRALVFPAALLLCVVSARADAAERHRPPAGTRIAPEQPLQIRLPQFRPTPPAELPLRLSPPDEAANDPLKASTVNIGPFSARLGGTRKKAQIARYRLEGMDLLGGSVSGTLDGRGARVYLRWPPSDDE